MKQNREPPDAFDQSRSIDSEWTALVCPRCDYPLTGLPEGRPCPECGYALGANPMIFRSRPRSAVQLMRLILGALACGWLTTGLVARILQNTPQHEVCALTLGLLLALLVIFAFRRPRRAIVIANEQVSHFVNSRPLEHVALRDLWLAEYDSRSDEITLMARDGKTLWKWTNLVPRSTRHGRDLAEVLTRRAREASNADG